MPLTATLNTDETGFTKGKAYPVIGFASSTALVLDDKGKIQHVSYVKLNDDELWSVADGEVKKTEEKKE